MDLAEAEENMKINLNKKKGGNYMFAEHTSVFFMIKQQIYNKATALNWSVSSKLYDSCEKTIE